MRHRTKTARVTLAPLSPHPVTRAPLMTRHDATSDAWTLEVITLSGEVVVDVAHLHPDEIYQVGSHRGAHSYISAESVPLDPFPLAVMGSRGDVIVNIPNGALNSAQGAVSDGDTHTPLQTLRDTGALTASDAPSSRALRLPLTARCALTLGDLTFLIRATPRPRPPARRPFIALFDSQLIEVTAWVAAFMLTCVFLVLRLSRFAPPPHPLDLPPPIPARFVVAPVVKYQEKDTFAYVHADRAYRCSCAFFDMSYRDLLLHRFIADDDDDSHNYGLFDPISELNPLTYFWIEHNKILDKMAIEDAEYGSRLVLYNGFVHRVTLTDLMSAQDQERDISHSHSPSHSPSPSHSQSQSQSHTLSLSQTVRRIIQTQSSEYRHCYEDLVYTLNQKNITGTVKVAFNLSFKRGNVTHAQVTEANLNAPSERLNACIVRALSSIRFNPIQRLKDTHVEYQLNLILSFKTSWRDPLEARKNQGL